MQWAQPPRNAWPARPASAHPRGSPKLAPRPAWLRPHPRRSRLQRKPPPRRCRARRLHARTRSQQARHPALPRRFRSRPRTVRRQSRRQARQTLLNTATARRGAEAGEAHEPPRPAVSNTRREGGQGCRGGSYDACRWTTVPKRQLFISPAPPYYVGRTTLRHVCALPTAPQPFLCRALVAAARCGDGGLAFWRRI
jgi:hypothetical protein